jgi:hypothetical protein
MTQAQTQPAIAAGDTKPTSPDRMRFQALSAPTKTGQTTQFEQTPNPARKIMRSRNAKKSRQATQPPHSSEPNTASGAGGGEREG